MADNDKKQDAEAAAAAAAAAKAAEDAAAAKAAADAAAALPAVAMVRAVRNDFYDPFAKKHYRQGVETEAVAGGWLDSQLEAGFIVKV